MKRKNLHNIGLWLVLDFETHFFIFLFLYTTIKFQLASFSLGPQRSSLALLETVLDVFVWLSAHVNTPGDL